MNIRDKLLRGNLRREPGFKETLEGRKHKSRQVFLQPNYQTQDIQILKAHLCSASRLRNGAKWIKKIFFESRLLK